VEVLTFQFGRKKELQSKASLQTQQMLICFEEKDVAARKNCASKYGFACCAFLSEDSGIVIGPFWSADTEFCSGVFQYLLNLS
jgi:hypothetical protein